METWNELVQHVAMCDEPLMRRLTSPKQQPVVARVGFSVAGATTTTTTTTTTSSAWIFGRS